MFICKKKGMYIFVKKKVKVNEMAVLVPYHYVKFLQFISSSGGSLSLKMQSYQYRDPHIKDKTVSRPSYL